MTFAHTYRSALIAGLLTAVFQTGAAAQANSAQGVRNVVIVHGAWADGSSCSKVIPLLQARGLHVVAVQNPLTSLADDVAATRRAIALQDGPVLLVAIPMEEWLSRKQEMIQRSSGWSMWPRSRHRMVSPLLRSPKRFRRLR
jgi:hypothetical protein